MVHAASRRSDAGRSREHGLFSIQRSREPPPRGRGKQRQDRGRNSVAVQARRRTRLGVAGRRIYVRRAENLRRQRHGLHPGRRSRRLPPAHGRLRRVVRSASRPHDLLQGDRQRLSARRMPWARQPEAGSAGSVLYGIVLHQRRADGGEPGESQGAGGGWRNREDAHDRRQAAHRSARAGAQRRARGDVLRTAGDAVHDVQGRRGSSSIAPRFSVAHARAAECTSRRVTTGSSRLRIPSATSSRPWTSPSEHSRPCASNSAHSPRGQASVTTACAPER